MDIIRLSSFKNRKTLPEGGSPGSRRKQDREKMTFVLDDQKPEICIRGIENHKTYRKNIKPEISIRDENLYRSRIEILCGGEKITDRILSRDGHYTITAAAEDKAGNRTEVKKCLRSIKRES